ncbi:unnamed protein product [Heligmosomoides polygyrus]|uniref:CCHC-type domain-containing protein n=1 Tax=Heligmosomoides polygyrus TaxID=6339 RepID=A0A183GXD7_HELPZ|nr:unnamed protein product [Heligmosomoides polygyrus]
MIEDGKPAVQAIEGQPESTPASASLYMPHRRQQSDHDHNRSRRSRRNNSHKTPPSPCWNCGGLHFVRDCPFLSHICSKCHIMGHKDGFCSPSQRRTRTKSSMRHSNGAPKQRIRSDAIIRISNIDCNHYRRYAIVTVDNQSRFQVDTASDITSSAI